MALLFHNHVKKPTTSYVTIPPSVAFPSQNKIFSEKPLELDKILILQRTIFRSRVSTKNPYTNATFHIICQRIAHAKCQENTVVIDD